MKAKRFEQQFDEGLDMRRSNVRARVLRTADRAPGIPENRTEVVQSKGTVGFLVGAVQVRPGAREKGPG